MKKYDYSMRNIMKLDYQKNRKCYLVRIYKKGDGGLICNDFRKYFYIDDYSTSEMCLKTAKTWRTKNENKLKKLGLLSNRKFERVRTMLMKNNKTGIAGVHYCITYINKGDNKKRSSVVATWSPKKYVYKNKKFFVTKKRSLDEAFELAVLFRKNKIKEILNNKD